MQVRAQNQPAGKDPKQETGKPNAKETKQTENKSMAKDAKPAIPRSAQRRRCVRRSTN